MNLKDLAKLLNLSPTTVSRALNGFPEVSEATRLRVQEAAQKHHYQPNAKAKSLATGRAHTIGHVLPVSAGHEMVNPVFTDFLAGASKTYLAAGYDLLISLVEDQEQEIAYRQLVGQGRVDGLIVHAPQREDNRLALLDALGLPFVVHGRMSQSAGYSWLDVNNERAFVRGTDCLLDLGHARIALVNGLETQIFAQHRRQGYSEALRQRGLQPSEALMASGEMSEPFGYASAARMLDAPQPPTAFLVSSMLIAIGVRRAVEERGKRLGREVSLITFDDQLSYFSDQQTVPIFTCLRSSVRAAGSRCAENLLQLIAQPGSEPIQELWEADLVLGESTAPPLAH